MKKFFAKSVVAGSLFFLTSLCVTSSLISMKLRQKIIRDVSTHEQLRKIIYKAIKRYKKQKKLDSVLLIFDIDETLVSHGIYDHIRYALKQWYQKVPETEVKERIIWQQRCLRCLATATQQHTIKPIDKDIFPMIANLQNIGVKTICLTSGGIGSYGPIPDLMQYRVDQFKSLGLNIDFSNQLGNYPETNLELSIRYRRIGKYKKFGFHKGIIFANQQPNDFKIPKIIRGHGIIKLEAKGLVLHTFLENVERKTVWKPSCIIFVDNLLSMVQSVCNAMKFNNVDFIGIESTQAVRQKQEEIRRDSDGLGQRIDRQLEALWNENLWIPDLQTSN